MSPCEIRRSFAPERCPSKMGRDRLINGTVIEVQGKIKSKDVVTADKPGNRSSYYNWRLNIRRLCMTRSERSD